MKKNQLLLFLVFLLSAVIAEAQGPNNSGTYYRDANGKSGAALKTALGNIINPHTNIGYDGLYEAYKKTDRRAEDKSKNEEYRAEGYLRDWYSNATSYTFDKRGSNSSEGAGWNREHSVPQSWFGSGIPKSDVVHVLPTDCYVNGRRSNNPLAEVGNVTWQSKNGYSKLGSCKTAGYSGTVFEPNDEIKGDMARIYFYMVTCYENSATSWGHSVFSSSKYPGFTQWYLDMLMRWAKQDPVDEREIARNNAVYEVQKNRNPFVDYPGLEDYVWGAKKDQAFSYDHYEGGSGGTIITVAQPLFSPYGGSYTDQVVVTMSTSTEGATIYYTTNNVDASTSSHVYEGPITLTSTTTLKAIAVKDGTSSYQTTATYTITTGSGGEQPVEGVIELNKNLFNLSGGPSFGANVTEDFVGTYNGITVTYALGEGGNNRYCSDSQIRLYQKNKLTISAGNNKMTKLEFQLDKETSKTLSASTGSVSDLIWTGNANSVTFNVDDGSGNMQLSKVTVSLAASGPDNISTVRNNSSQSKSFYTLSGQRITTPTKGIYIQNGKKYVVR